MYFPSEQTQVVEEEMEEEMEEEFCDPVDDWRKFYESTWYSANMSTLPVDFDDDPNAMIARRLTLPRPDGNSLRARASAWTKDDWLRKTGLILSSAQHIEQPPLDLGEQSDEESTMTISALHHQQVSDPLREVAAVARRTDTQSKPTAN